MNKGTIEQPYCDKKEYKGWTIYIHFHKEADPKWYDFFRYTRVKGDKIQGCGGHFKNERLATEAAMEWIDYDERIIEIGIPPNAITMSTFNQPYCDKSEHKGWTIYITRHKHTDPQYTEDGIFRYVRVKEDKLVDSFGHFKDEHDATKTAMMIIDCEEDVVDKKKKEEAKINYKQGKLSDNWDLGEPCSLDKMEECESCQ